VFQEVSQQNQKKEEGNSESGSLAKQDKVGRNRKGKEEYLLPDTWQVGVT
jgi:hypothetical protein